ncbi:hypothetical protein HYPSUDRAFT_74910 [Hypholoma sublateritium FD-334 SS-4]|uniref:Endonuclease/exonuclease/phosphatase domain-containing protein n=1 Tax=Hypholoma sublateritium (strain FD-334 SS-4) TaxID=945553 RepID=A0A0D2LID0_HYPSF|nr:hypothetical protein HYPSUDRAFT_74910 [Hypholoma sublateritium FD-334 SS-4]
MRGRFHNGIDKWMHINQIIRNDKIGILCLQETHLTATAATELNDRFSNRMHIITSPNPTHPNANGVTIVVNKNLANSANIITHNLIPGRALMTTIPWHRDKSLTVLNIYAPNNHQENARFWEIINDELRGKPTPDVILGDFNMVEDALDRLPPHCDPTTSVEKLAELMTSLQLVDGWRTANPDTLQYTYSQTIRQGASHSRIDRIYLNKDCTQFTNDWKITTPGIHTDHQMVSVYLTDATLPYIGKGRWVIPTHLLKNKKVMQILTELCYEAEIEMKEIKERTPTNNAQLIFNNLMKNLKATAIDEGYKASNNIDIKIRKLESRRLRKINNPNKTVEARQISNSLLQEKIKTWANIKHQKARDNLAAKYRIESERASSGFWAKTGKDRPPRDTILELLIPESNPPQYERRSDKMANLAKEYHNLLQSKDRNENNNTDVEEALAHPSQYKAFQMEKQQE